MHWHFAAVMAIAVLATALLASEPPQGTGQSPFRARSVTRTGSLHLSSTADRVFPLFGPVREKEWAEGWEPEVIYPADAVATEGMVFQVTHAGEPTTIWTITRLDTVQHEVVYHLVTPGLRVGRIQVQCRDNGDGISTVNVTYTFTTLSEAGNRFLESLDEASYAGRMRHWEHAINFYLRTGRRAPHH